MAVCSIAVCSIAISRGGGGGMPLKIDAPRCILVGF